VLVTFIVVQLPVYAQLPKPVSLTLQNEGYSDLSLAGMFGSASVYLFFPSNWVATQDIQVNLVYTASPVINRDHSTLTVRVNDQNIFTLHPTGDGVMHTATFNIPKNVATPLSNGLRVDFNAFSRVSDEICEQPSNPGQWMTISNQTELLLPVQESVAAPQLDQLNRTIVVQRAFYTPPPVVFVLPDKWNTTVLSTAAQIAARLGKAFSGTKPTFSMVRSSELTTQIKNDSNLIFIGKSNEWPSIAGLPVNQPKPTPSATPGKGLIFTPTPTLLAPTVPPNIGYIKIINSPWNPTRKLLLINANSDAELAQINTVFANDARFALLRGSVIGLDALASSAVNPSQPSPWLSTRVTLAQLGEADRQLSGTSPQNTYYEIQLPDGWILDPGSQFTLNVANSPAISSEISHVAVYANNFLTGAVADTHNGQEHSATLNLPVDRLQGDPGGRRTQHIEFRLTVFNTLVMAQCQTTTSDTVVWTRINATSSLVVPHHYMSLPDLQAFPYPFLSDKDSAPVVIVLPNKPDNTIIGDALTLAATLGNRAIMEFDVSIATADEVTQRKYANTHLIVLGTKNNQPLFDKFTQSLASSKDDSVVSAFKNANYGILYETISPWNPQRLILLVSSATDTGYTSAFHWLANNVPPVDRSGSIAVVGSDEAPRVIYQAVTPTPTASPTEASTQPPTESAATASPTPAATTATTEVATMASTAPQ
jgi:hypothetical protein